ncbi:hypothetical protein ALC152_07430 [Arcobacter sp. 15-2]|uniref:hypothetical protein n=1 Tax=Arcobacter sp. 15-2 TaxID=3374109 RepID=UPI00399C7551
MKETLYREYKQNLEWFQSIGKKFFTIVPKNSFKSIMLILISEVSFLIAFLVPIKILMLMGGNSLNKYFLVYIENYGYDIVVLLLSFLSILFYIIHLYCEKYIKKISYESSSLLLEKSAKINIYENQSEIAFNLYGRFIKTLSSLIYVVLSFIVLFIIYQYIFKILLFLPLVYMLIFYIVYSIQPKLDIQKYINNIASLISGSSFLIIFLFIIIDFLYYTPPNLLITIITFILARQISTQFSKILLNINYLLKNRVILNTLFYHSHKLNTTLVEDNNEFLDILLPKNRKNWLRNILMEIDLEIQTFKIIWKDNILVDVISFEVHSLDDKQIIKNKYFIKLYNKNKTKFAKNEAMLLSYSHNLPSMKILLSTKVNNFICNIFMYRREIHPKSTVLSSLEQKLKTRLLITKLNEECILQYQRSHQLLYERLNDTFIKRLKLVDNGKYSEVIELFSNKLDGIRIILEKLPLTIINPNINKNFILVDKSDKPILLDWSNCTIEPMGSGWLIDGKNLELLKKIIKINKLSVSAENAVLSSIMYQIDRLFKTQRYEQVLKMIYQNKSIFEKIH